MLHFFRFLFASFFIAMCSFAASPEVQSDGSVVFRLAMPNAQKVDLNLDGEGARLSMAKGSDGAWSITVPKLAPGYYSYTFVVDGVAILDPQNVSIRPSLLAPASAFLVPGKLMPWEPTDVPHGVVHHHFYKSKIVGRDSEYYVYTPPGFSAKKNTTFPVLYLLHGFSSDASGWINVGRANVILDNLIAQRKVKPMIVVMPLGYGTMEMIERGNKAWDDTELIRRNFNQFSQVLFQEVIPLVNGQYPISAKRDDHAVAGLSMGGTESLLTGLNHTDDFAYVGSFSAAGFGDDNFQQWFPELTTKNAARLNTKLRLLWIACGTEDSLLTSNQKFIAWLQQQGLKPVEIKTPGAHAWKVWRNNFVNFTSLLFK